jgi:hypothetical protein
VLFWLAAYSLIWVYTLISPILYLLYG